MYVQQIGLHLLLEYRLENESNRHLRLKMLVDCAYIMADDLEAEGFRLTGSALLDALHHALHTQSLHCLHDCCSYFSLIMEGEKDKR